VFRTQSDLWLLVGLLRTCCTRSVLCQLSAQPAACKVHDNAAAWFTSRLLCLMPIPHFSGLAQARACLGVVPPAFGSSHASVAALLVRAGTGADEALSSITRSRMPINNAPFTDAEGNVDLGAKAAFSQDMINRSGIPQGGLGRRKGPSTQSQHEGLRSTANNMLEDALETAPSATAGRT